MFAKDILQGNHDSECRMEYEVRTPFFKAVNQRVSNLKLFPD